MRKNDGLLWAIFTAAMLVAALSHAQTNSERKLLLIGLPEAQALMLERYAAEGPTTNTLAAIYLCELAELPHAMRGVVKRDDGTTMTVWVPTYNAWSMLMADLFLRHPHPDRL